MEKEVGERKGLKKGGKNKQCFVLSCSSICLCGLVLGHVCINVSPFLQFSNITNVCVKISHRKLS